METHDTIPMTPTEGGFPSPSMPPEFSMASEVQHINDLVTEKLNLQSELKTIKKEKSWGAVVSGYIPKCFQKRALGPIDEEAKTKRLHEVVQDLKKNISELHNKIEVHLGGSGAWSTMKHQITRGPKWAVSKLLESSLHEISANPLSLGSKITDSITKGKELLQRTGTASTEVLGKVVGIAGTAMTLTSIATAVHRVLSKQVPLSKALGTLSQQSLAGAVWPLGNIPKLITCGAVAAGAGLGAYFSYNPESFQKARIDRIFQVSTEANQDTKSGDRNSLNEVLRNLSGLRESLEEEESPYMKGLISQTGLSLVSGRLDRPIKRLLRTAQRFQETKDREGAFFYNLGATALNKIKKWLGGNEVDISAINPFAQSSIREGTTETIKTVATAAAERVIKAELVSAGTAVVTSFHTTSLLA